MKRIKYSSNTHWEREFAYSRAIKVGDHIEVAGTVATRDGKIVAPGDAYAQTVYIFQKIEDSLKALGADLSHVVRTRLYLCDIKDWKDVGKAHGEIFKGIEPVSSMMEVGSLISEEFRVEIEVTAVLDK
jgi:enamine deaminase RidA (YjgF/YER057c/UK114 family)